MLYSLCNELEKIGVPWCTPNGTKVNYHLREQYDMYKEFIEKDVISLLKPAKAEFKIYTT